MQEQQEFRVFIKNKGFLTSPSFNSDSKSLMKLVRFVQNLQPSQQSFQIMKNLIKFYRIPILIAFQPFYAKLQQKYTENTEKYQTFIKQIASYVKSYLENYKLEELNFFYILGIGKKRKSLQKSEQQIEFIQYIQELGKDITKLKANSKSMQPEDLKLELDSILARSLNRKMNPLERNYELYFKKQADKIYHENKKIIEEQFLSKENEKKSLQKEPDPVEEVSQHICCRKFFEDRQIIKQPENLVLEYKNYSFPFDETRTLILKKTFCAFLNTNGGIIFLGIHENVDNKMRKVFGMQLTEAEKEKLLFSIRLIAQSIEPDIIPNKMYNIDFVPIKSANPPHNYIAGRFLVKITIKFGIRDEIYSYKHDGKDYFSFRTENQVIHREGRQVINAYRERIKNPLPEPVPIHPGPCQIPDKGSQIYDDVKFSKQDFPSLNSVTRQKTKYREKDAIDFIICRIKQKSLLKLLNEEKLSDSVDIRTNENELFLKIINNKVRDNITQTLQEAESKNMLELYSVERGILVERKIKGLVIDLLKEKRIVFDILDTPGEEVCYKLKNSEDSIQTFLLLMEYGFRPKFSVV